MSRPTQAFIDLQALRHNVSIARSLAGTARLMAVVKANAYGHGAHAIAEALSSEVDAFAVACLDEALALRERGIQRPILLLEGVFDTSELQAAAAAALWMTIASDAQLSQLECAQLSQPVHCWLKVDTGMHRLGVGVEQTSQALHRLRNSANSDGAPTLFTHFVAAEATDSAETKTQLALFNTIETNGPRSACNSAGIIAWPDAHFDWVRPGYMLYGNSPMTGKHPAAESLRPVMTLQSQITALRDIPAGDTVGYNGTWRAKRPSRIATVPIGYGDGYPRGAKPGTPVLVGTQRAALAGRVSMDMITVDVTDLPAVAIGDTVTLWGPALPVEEVASHADTNGYELTTRMPARTPRIIVDGPQDD